MAQKSLDPRSESMIEVEIATRDSQYRIVELSGRHGCRMELTELVPRGDGTFGALYNVTGLSAEDRETFGGRDRNPDVYLLDEHDDGGLFEFRVAEDCPAVRLGSLGAIPRFVAGETGQGRIVCEIPPWEDESATVREFLAASDDATLVAKRRSEATSTLFSPSAFEQMLRTRLTDRQLEILEAAYEAGYFDWPRRCTGEDVAEDLGISSPTFSQHVHAAQRKLLGLLFETAI